MKVLKITNPLYVGRIAPLILKFYNRVKETSGMYEGITYETIYAYLARTAQYGGELAEVWVAYDGDTPVGFACWKVMDLPHIGKVYCDCLYNDVRNQKAIKGLYEEFINFGKRHRAPLYQFDALNEKVGEHFVRVADKLGVDFKDSGAKNYIGRTK
ncbi:MAG: hypothetical protein ACFFCW_00405 [Candidatus Hodarchaeota archaeon]